MADDRIDWCDVAAVGVIADVLSTSASRGPVASLLEDLRREWCRDFRGGFTRDVGKAADALREAHEAGLREASSTPRGGLIAARQDAERRELSALADLDEATAELRALRRELAARRAVDRWLRQWNHHLEVEHDGLHVRGPNRGPFHIEAPDYPALAAALGLEVWE